MTDTEIKQYFRQITSKASGKICGSFRPDQLNRALVSTEPTGSLLWAKVWLSLGLIFSWAGKAESQDMQIPPQEILPTAYNNLPTQHIQANDFVISGNVLEKISSTPISVMVQLTDKAGNVLASTISDENNGSFVLRLPENQLQKRMNIVVIQNGIPTNSFPIKPKSKKKELKKELRVNYQPEIPILGEPSIDE
jgi:hypothetical protein